ncbi:hypothetical protein CRENBAI_002358 [Crenichthys baileyi]|uniref:Growth hormone/erythropoietin receptor ligand binding domain-containing protein n=1 Tax=Crenichthys baileyi TaxID=28760 RepID=A0AAV9SFB8_9TELE
MSFMTDLSGRKRKWRGSLFLVTCTMTGGGDAVSRLLSFGTAAERKSLSAFEILSLGLLTLKLDFPTIIEAPWGHRWKRRTFSAHGEAAASSLRKSLIGRDTTTTAASKASSDLSAAERLEMTVKTASTCATATKPIDDLGLFVALNLIHAWEQDTNAFVVHASDSCESRGGLPTGLAYGQLDPDAAANVTGRPQIYYCRSPNMEDFTCWWLPMDNLTAGEEVTYVFTYSIECVPNFCCNLT